jgi:zinc/manganese transport system permease protein
MTADNGFWLAAPLTAGLLIALCLVPLGHRVLSRGMVFADLAIAQWAALGSLAGMALFPAPALAGLPISGLLFALLCVGLVHLILRWVPDYREAMIGLLYVVGASLATLLVSRDPHGAQQLARTLSGDLLWVTPTALIPLVAIGLMITVWQWLMPERWREPMFLVLFSVAVTLTVELAGIYVVFASLIAAPLMLCHLAGRSVLTAVLVAFAGQGAGLLASAIFDLPAGPAVVLAIVLVSLAVLVVARRPARVFSQ